MSVMDSDGQPLLEKILDTAGQKGTGTWTTIDALEHGIPLTLIGEAVFARALSALKEDRLKAAAIYSQPSSSSSATHTPFNGDKAAALDALHDALYAAKIISYAQGFMLMQQASTHYDWKLDYGNIALTWRGGCIIRSRFLNNIKQAYEQAGENDQQLDNLLLDDFFSSAIQQALAGWRTTVQTAVGMAIPVPAFSSALSFFDGYRATRTSANLLQAQRDYFGAHSYERIDQPRGAFFHTNWIANKK